MLRTWAYNPRDRVSFTEIFAELEAMDLAAMSKGSVSSAAKNVKPKKQTVKASVDKQQVSESDGYVDDRPAANPKKVAVEDGYVADNPPPRPTKAATKKPASNYSEDPVIKKPATSNIRQNALYMDQGSAQEIRDSELAQQYEAEMQLQQKKVPSTLFAGESRPQLRAAGTTPDGGYIDTTTLTSVQVLTAKPALRAGGGPVAMMPLDLLSMLASLGLHHYVPYFLSCGLTVIDAASASMINDLFLQQLGIYDPGHRFMILSAIVGYFKGSISILSLFHGSTIIFQAACPPAWHQRAPWEPGRQMQQLLRQSPKLRTFQIQNQLRLLVARRLLPTVRQVRLGRNRLLRAGRSKRQSQQPQQVRLVS